MARQFKTQFKVGQKVKFYSTHDKFNPQTGTIQRIYPNDAEGNGADFVDIDVPAADGKSQTVAAHAQDVTLLADAEEKKTA
jgi:hypothetical protein